MSVRGRVAAVDSPRDGSSPSFSAKYLITPADTRQAGGNAAQNESPALGEKGPLLPGYSPRRGRRGKSFTGGDWLAAQLWPLHDGEKM